MSSVINAQGSNPFGKVNEPYIIAEIGTNHNQDFDRAKDLIKAAADTGFDCVKFQTYEPHEIVSHLVMARDYGLDSLYGDITATEMFEKFLKTPKKWFPELKNLCRELDIDCATTIHGSNGLEWANCIGFDVIKIASMDHNNISFLESLVNTVDAPILVSFGMASLDDIKLTVRSLKPHRNGVGIFHCVSIYPPRPDEMRLGNISYLVNNFEVPVGFSDHADDVITSLAAYLLGATFFEKHITLDRSLQGPDHPFALDPKQMKSYVNGIRSLASTVGSKKFEPPTSREAANKVSYMKSITAMRDLVAGDILKGTDLTLVRPGTGIPPKDLNLVIGRVLLKSVKKGNPIKWVDIAAV